MIAAPTQTYTVLTPAGNTLARVTADLAATWMAEHSALDFADARLALAVCLPGEEVRCAQIRVRVNGA